MDGKGGGKGEGEEEGEGRGKGERGGCPPFRKFLDPPLVAALQIACLHYAYQYLYSPHR